MITIPRREVVSFAVTMEEVLRANDHKKGWDDLDPDYIIERLREEVEELAAALQYDSGEVPDLDEAQRNAVLHEAADVANFAMFAAYKFGKMKIY